MTPDAVQQLTDTTWLVTEGDARAVWARTQFSNWSFSHIWPSHDERAALERHLSVGGSLLVLVPANVAPVFAFPEELGSASDDGPDDLAEVEIPMLDWLPQQARDRALRFVPDARTARGPLALQPPIRVSEPLLPYPNARLIVATSRIAAAIGAGELRELAHFLFAGQPVVPHTTK